MTHDKHASPSTHRDEHDGDRTHKIQNLREMISTAEQTIQSAKAMLLQLEGKKKVGRKRKVEEIENGSIVQGTFDGQIMIGGDGKHYPVPANYASKSKLVQGDMLKLTITDDGSFIYKQIGPAERKHAIGIASQDENGNYYIVADGKAYRVLLASITYFRVEPGDEVAIVLPRDLDAQWAAVENIIQKASLMGAKTPMAAPAIPKPSTDMEHWKKDVQDVGTTPEPVMETPTEPKSLEEPATEEPTPTTPESALAPAESSDNGDALRQEIIDEWMKELETKKDEPAA